MLPSWARQLFRKKFLGHGTVAPIHHALSVEALEDRALMTTATWTGAYSLNHPTLPADYTWSNPENWANLYRPNDDGDGAPDDVLFPSIPNGLAKPNAVLVGTAVSFPANSIVDGDYDIGTLQIQGDNYHIDATTPATITLSGGLTVNFAGTVGVISGLSLIGPLSNTTTSNLRINLNGNVNIPGVGIVNQFANINTGELYINATLADAPTKTVGIVKVGTGAITLGGVNVYTGVTSVQAGTLVAASDGAFGSSLAETRVSSGATVGISGGRVSDALQIVGTGVNNQGALRGRTDSLLTFRNFIPSGGGSWVGGIAMVGDATIGTDAAADVAIDVRGISGNGNLTKVGFGDLSLFVDSVYTGNTLITQGSVSIYTDNALSPGFKTTVANEASLNLDAGLTVNETLELTGNGFSRFDDGFGRPAGALSLFSTGTSTWLGSITIISSAATPPTSRGASIGAIPNATLVLAGQLIGASANNTFTKVDEGNVRIARANPTFLGGTAVDNGTLEVADALAVGSGAITVNSNLANSAIGTLQLEGTALTLTQLLTLNGPGSDNAGAVHVVAPLGGGPLAASNITLAGGFRLASTTALNVDPRSTLNVTGTVSDVPQSPPAELDKLGDGTLVLSGNNTYTGQTVLRAGVTSVRSATALGTTASGTSITSGAILSLDAPAGLTIANESLTLSGSNTSTTRSTFRAGAGSNVWTGNVNFTLNNNAPVNVEVASGASLELRASLGGAAEVHKVGLGYLSFTGAGANNNNGTIYVDAGALGLGKIGGNATNGPVVIGDDLGASTDTLFLLASDQLADGQSVTVNSTGLFSLNGFNETIGGSVALTVAGGAVQTGAGTLSLNGDISTSGSVAASNISGSIFLTATRTFVFRPTPGLMLTSSLNSSQFTNDVTFTVTTNRTGTEPTVSGSVAFYDGDTLIDSVQSLAPDPNNLINGTIASVTTNALSGGLHTIKVVYFGNNFYAPVTMFLAQPQAVRNVPVYSSLQSSAITVEPLLPVTYTYHVTAPTGATVAPTGTVTFYDNGVPIGVAQTLTVDGFAYITKSFPIPTTAAEKLHVITATYSGDLFFSSNTVTLSAPAQGTSPYTRPVGQQVAYQPLVQLTSNNNAITGVRDATITFQASGGQGQPTPAGTVEFFLDGVSLNDTLNLGGPLPVDSTGKVVLTIPEQIVVGVTNATWSSGTATITTNFAHGLTAGQTVTITGINPGGYNGTFTVLSATTNSFTYALASQPTTPYVSGGNVSTTAITGATWTAGTATSAPFATITTNSPSFLNVGDTVTITGVNPGGYNGTFRVTSASANSFTYTLLNNPGTYTSGGVVSTATIVVSPLGTAGQHQITAEYISSDITFANAVATLGVPETSGGEIRNIEADTPVVAQFFSNKSSVRASAIAGDNPIVIDPVSFTFRVNTNDTGNFGGSGDPLHPTPTGTVTFSYVDVNGTTRTLGTVEIGTLLTLGGPGGTVTGSQNGEATIANVSFPRNLVPNPGSVTVTASYSGDDYYAPISRTTVQGFVTPATTVRLSSSNSQAIVGESVTYRLEVSSTSNATPPVTTLGGGFAVFTIRDALGNVVAGSGTTGVNGGVATFTTSFTLSGTYTVTAQYFGDANFGATTVTLTPSQIVVAPFDAVLVSSANTVPSGFNVTFTYRSAYGFYEDTTLAPQTPPAPLTAGAQTPFTVRGTAPTPTGTVTFFDGSNQIGQTQFLAADGTASVTVNNLAIGARNIRAVYSGDDVYPTTTTFLGEVQVVGTPPLLKVTTSNDVIEQGDTVTISVAASGANGLPTGRVTIRDGTGATPAVIASGILLRNGVATFSTSALAPGRHTFIVEYTGDSAYAPVLTTMTQDLLVIDPVRFQVKTSANADVSGSPTAVTYPVVAGSTVTYTAELVTGNGANAGGSVTFNVFDSNNVLVDTVTVPLTVTSVTVGTVTTFTAGASVARTAPAGVGSYRVVAMYSGDTRYEPLTAEFVQPVVATVAALPAAAPAATTVSRQQPVVGVSAVISGAPGAGVVSSGTGNLTLSGVNTYSGSTLITGAGNLVTLGANNVFPDTTALTITAGTLNVNGKTDTVGSLEGTGNLQLPVGSAFTAGGLNTDTDFTGVITGAGTLNKVGIGALTLGGASPAYTGMTNVVAGTVFLAANLGASSATVQSGATLAGSGTVKNVVVNAGGRLSPGGTAVNPSTVGVLNGTGNLTLTPGSQFVVDARGPTPGAVNGYDQYSVSGGGSVDLGGAMLSFLPIAGLAIDDVTPSFRIIQVSGGGTVSGRFAGLPNSGDKFTIGNRVFQISYNTTSVDIKVLALVSTASLTSNLNPSLPGQPVTFTVTITPVNVGDPTPQGVVRFFDGATEISAATFPGGVPLVNGVATFTAPALANGSHAISATFTPAATPVQNRYEPRSQAELSLTQAVTVPSTTTLVALQGPIVFGDGASFVATVAQQTGLSVPSGVVTFINAATGAVIGSAALDANGQARLTVTTLPAGTLTIVASYAGDSFYRASSASVTQVVDRQARIVVGSDAGPVTTVQVFDPRTGALLRTINPFDQYTLGVKVATGDVNGDGVADIVVSAGAGAPGGHVRVFDGVTFNEIASFFTFIGYTGGVNVAVGDVDGDGFGDVIVGTAIANDHVKAFSGKLLLGGGGIAANGTADPSTIQSFFAYSDNGGNTVGVTVGTGDVNGDGRADIITGSATFAGHVRVFAGGAGKTELASYFAYGQGYLGGIYVAGGDLDGDGKAEIITGATNAPHVKALRLDGSEAASFFAYLNPDGTPANFGVRVAAVDRNGDRLADILTGSGGAAPAVKVFSGLDPSLLLESFIATPPGQKPSTSGVFVGGSGLK